ncbi:unnamed protein product [Sphagnum balticum]
MHPIILLEGSDGSGKTTLAKKLVDRLGGTYIHATYRFTEALPTYQRAIFELALIKAQTQPVIIDRLHYSETIYAKVFRGGSPWPMFTRQMDRVMQRYNVLHVFCLPSDYEAHDARFSASVKAGKEMYDKNVEVATAYETLVDNLEPRQDVAIYDIDSDGKDMSTYIDELTEVAYDGVAIQETYNVCQENSRDWAGNLFGEVVLVGDVSNSKTRRATWPFFEHANSSLWLTERLDNMNLSEDKILWLNAYDHSGTLNGGLFPLIRYVHRKLIVALGNNAAKALHKANIPFIKVPHPQYLRRFRHNSDITEFMDTFTYNRLKEVVDEGIIGK